MKSVFPLSLWISFILSDEIWLLSGALNSVSWEGPECLFRASRCRSHGGKRTLQVAQVSGAIQVHGEAICIPLSPAMLHTQLRFTEAGREGCQEPVMAWPDTVLPMPGRPGLRHLRTSPVPIAGEGCNWLSSSRSKSLRQKIPGLGKKSPVPLEPLAEVKGPR